MQDKRTGRWLAIGLLAASAFAVTAAIAAGQGSNASSSPSSADSMSASPPASSAAASASAAADSSSMPAPSGQPSGGVVDHVTNGPVPDTPANRARNGQPMSHAGQTTAPAAN